MAENIIGMGKALKILAVIVMIAAVLGTVVVGISVELEPGIDFVVIMGGFLSAIVSYAVLYGFGILVEKAEKDMAEKTILPAFYGSNPTEQSQPVSAQPAKTSAAPAGVIKDGWRCTCGKVNPSYMSSCSCGKTAREIREMNKK